ncbi:MAG: hypothetical protein HRT66_11890 [Flavobacteriaceae bacterium]|nr:hypothetical protein [Flavobacteriaceae bacterium]
MKLKYLFIFFIISQISYSQCVMCKAVIEKGDADIAEGVNSGIMYLMVFPYLSIALLIYFLVKYMKKNKIS